MNDITLRDIDIPFARAVKILFTWTFASLVVSAAFAIPIFILWGILMVIFLVALAGSV